MKLLFFGDIVAKAGRVALRKVLPEWRRRYQPEAVVGCVDNLAHGRGATEKTLKELIDLGFNAFTTGDHVLNSELGLKLLEQENLPLIRPLNYSSSLPGVGAKVINVAGQNLLIVHLMGQVFMPAGYTSPFEAIDQLLTSPTITDTTKSIFVDIHAEATSEKVALGWYLDGRVTAVVGTHTHVPTADEWIMPGGTAYITDVGMTGIRESILGVKKEIILDRFVRGGRERFEPAETGTATVAAVLITFDPKSGQAKAIERLSQLVTIP